MGAEFSSNGSGRQRLHPLYHLKMDLCSANVEACDRVAACVWRSAACEGASAVPAAAQAIIFFFSEVTEYLQNNFVCRYFFFLATVLPLRHLM